MFAASFTVVPASMVVGNSSVEATVTASLALATRASPDCWHSAPFSAFCASAASHSFCRSAAASAIFRRRLFSLRFICRNAEGSFGRPGRPFAFGRPSVFGRLRAFGSNDIVRIVDFIGGLLRLRLGFCGNYRIKDRLIRWKTTSRLITHVCPNKQRRTGMRENGERERAIENNPHGFWHRFGRATRRHSEDGICRAFRCGQKDALFRREDGCQLRR